MNPEQQQQPQELSNSHGHPNWSSMALYNHSGGIPPSSTSSTSSSFSTNKRQRGENDDCSSDGTLSSTFSWPTATNATAAVTSDSSFYNNSLNVTSNFKRMKLEHNPSATPYASNLQYPFDNSSMPNISIPTISTRIEEDRPMEYSSVNKLLGDLHRHRKHRLTSAPIIQPRQNHRYDPFSSQLDSSYPFSPTNAALMVPRHYSNNHQMPMASQNDSNNRKSLKRTNLQTHSSLY